MTQVTGPQGHDETQYTPIKPAEQGTYFGRLVGAVKSAGSLVATLFSAAKPAAQEAKAFSKDKQVKVLDEDAVEAALTTVAARKTFVTSDTGWQQYVASVSCTEDEKAEIGQLAMNERLMFFVEEHVAELSEQASQIDQGREKFSLKKFAYVVAECVDFVITEKDRESSAKLLGEITEGIQEFSKSFLAACTPEVTELEAHLENVEHFDDYCQARVLARQLQQECQAGLKAVQKQLVQMQTIQESLTSDNPHIDTIRSLVKTLGQIEQSLKEVDSRLRAACTPSESQAKLLQKEPLPNRADADQDLVVLREKMLVLREVGQPVDEAEFWAVSKEIIDSKNEKSMVSELYTALPVLTKEKQARIAQEKETEHVFTHEDSSSISWASIALLAIVAGGVGVAAYSHMQQTAVSESQAQPPQIESGVVANNLAANQLVANPLAANHTVTALSVPERPPMSSQGSRDGGVLPRLITGTAHLVTNVWDRAQRGVLGSEWVDAVQAISRGDSKELLTLIEDGVNPADVIQKAVDLNKPEVVAAVLPTLPDSQRAEVASQLLAQAACSDNLEIVRVLIQNGANPQTIPEGKYAYAVEYNGQGYPLLYALLTSSKDHSSTVLALLESPLADATVLVSTKLFGLKKESLLSAALQHKAKGKVIQKLIERGAKPSLSDFKSVIENHNLDLLRLFMKNDPAGVLAHGPELMRCAFDVINLEAANLLSRAGVSQVVQGMEFPFAKNPDSFLKVLFSAAQEFENRQRAESDEPLKTQLFVLQLRDFVSEHSSLHPAEHFAGGKSAFTFAHELMQAAQKQNAALNPQILSSLEQVITKAEKTDMPMDVLRTNPEAVQKSISAFLEKPIEQQARVFGHHPLVLAAEMGDNDLFDKVLAQCDPQVLKAETGKAAFLACVANNAPEKMQMLLDKGVDPAVASAKGENPLIQAMQFGFTPIVEILAANKQLIDMQDNTGQSPLAFAIKTRRAEAAALLLQQGATLTESSRALMASDPDFRDSLVMQLPFESPLGQELLAIPVGSARQRLEGIAQAIKDAPKERQDVGSWYVMHVNLPTERLQLTSENPYQKHQSIRPGASALRSQLAEDVAALLNTNLPQGASPLHLVPTAVVSGVETENADQRQMRVMGDLWNKRYQADVDKNLATVSAAVPGARGLDSLTKEQVASIPQEDWIKTVVFDIIVGNCNRDSSSGLLARPETTSEGVRYRLVLGGHGETFPTKEAVTHNNLRWDERNQEALKQPLSEEWKQWIAQINDDAIIQTIRDNKEAYIQKFPTLQSDFTSNNYLRIKAAVAMLKYAVARGETLDHIVNTHLFGSASTLGEFINKANDAGYFSAETTLMDSVWRFRK